MQEKKKKEKRKRVKYQINRCPDGHSISSNLLQLNRVRRGRGLCPRRPPLSLMLIMLMVVVVLVVLAMLIIIVVVPVAIVVHM